MGTFGSRRMTLEGRLYLAVVIDLFARRIIGWSVSDRLYSKLDLQALEKTITMRRLLKGLIHHSDRGSQYCSFDYQAKLKEKGIMISMTGKGDCNHNAMVETFFKTFKSAMIWRTVFHTRDDAQKANAQYIDGFCNPVRRHSSLDYMSPAHFERKAV